MYEFKVNLNDDDFLEFNKFHFLTSLSGRRNLLYFRLIMPFICFVFIVVLFVINMDFEFIMIQLIIMTVLSVLWILFGKKMLFISMKSGMKKLRNEGKLPFSSEALIKFDDESIYEITQNVENKIRYAMVEKVKVTDKAIYVYISSVQAIIIKKDVFADDEEIQKFLDFVNFKTGVH